MANCATFRPWDIEDGKDDTLSIVEVNTGSTVIGKGMPAFPGGRDHGMSDIMIARQPGRPPAPVCRTTEEGERQMRSRESDRRGFSMN